MAGTTVTINKTCPDPGLQAAVNAVNALITDFDALITAVNALGTKLNADATVTDTNYKTDNAATTAAPISMS